MKDNRNQPQPWSDAQNGRPRWQLGVIYETLQAERQNWLLFQPVFLGCGIGLYFGLHFEPPLWAFAAAILALVGLALSVRCLVRIIAGILVVIIAGGALAKVRTEWVRAPVLEKRMRAAIVKGFVETVEPSATRGQRLTLRVRSISGVSKTKQPAQVRVRAMKVTEGLAPGDAITIKATLSPPSAPALPGGFDFSRLAWFQQLGAVGYSLTAPQRDTGPSKPPWHLQLAAPIEQLRQSIGERITAVISGQSGAIANALITGARGGITEETNDAYRDSGLYHMLSISGLHMAIMAGAVFFAVRIGLAAIPAIALRYPIKKWAAVAAALAALAYLMIAGSAFATVRSYIMISIMFLAILLDKPAITMRNVALAALIILVLYPESLLDVGFQMSFAAVAALVASYDVLRRSASVSSFWRHSVIARPVVFFAGIVMSTLVAGIAVAPFSAYHFHNAQQFAVLANLIAMPVCNFIVMPAALLALVLMPVGLEWAPLTVMGLGIDAMSWSARWTASLPGAVSHVPAIPMSAFLLMVVGGLWLCLWRTRARAAGLALIGAGLIIAPLQERPDILIGNNAGLVALREHGQDNFRALSKGGGTYELQRWLEQDGDPRKARDVLRAGKKDQALRCDGTGCTATVKNRKVAVSRHPAALRDDCRRADILVLDIPQPKGCNDPAAVVDVFDLRNWGTHAVYLADDHARIETVAQHRGIRPWAPAPRLPVPKINRSRPGNSTVPSQSNR